jgi:hypothetical protein
MRTKPAKNLRIHARVDEQFAARIDQCVAVGRMFKPGLDRSEFIRSALEQAMAASGKAA